MSSSPRVRFAPSPTGFLHIGGVRTALFNYLYARKHGGQFLLRIEDTDTERSQDQYTQDILTSLQWLGLEADEPIVHQMSRMEHYQKTAESWLSEGKAYRCFCTVQELEQMRAEQMARGEKPRYNRKCRDENHAHDSSRPYVIRAKIPLDGEAVFEDLIHGEIRIQNSELDDFVLFRSSSGGQWGAPTYNFTVVLDDVEMKITHVIRGDDHINNTPKQLHLYRFLSAPLPLFAHLPMILGPDKKKLSKRVGDLSANVYRAQGYLPEALLNFLVRLGWSHGDQEVFTMKELVEFFDFDHVQKSAAVYNIDKLQWLNSEHIRRTPSDELLKIMIRDFENRFQPEAKALWNSKFAEGCVELLKPKAKFLGEMAESLSLLLYPGTPDLSAMKDSWFGKKAELKQPVLHAVEGLAHEFRQALGAHPTLADSGFHHSEVQEVFQRACEAHGLKLGELANPVRNLLTGGKAAVGMFDWIAIMPGEWLISRLARAPEIV